MHRIQQSILGIRGTHWTDRNYYKLQIQFVPIKMARDPASPVKIAAKSRLALNGILPRFHRAFFERDRPLYPDIQLYCYRRQRGLHGIGATKDRLPVSLAARLTGLLRNS